MKVPDVVPVIASQRSPHAWKATATAYLPAAPGPAAALDLLCFHHAGGAASAFTGWSAAVGPAVRVLPVQLPGRERRVREPRFREMTALLDDLERELGPYLEGRYACYGHSMGALVAFALAHRRAESGRRGPVRLLLGAHAAPHRPRALGSVDGMDDLALARLLIGMGGMSETLLDYPDWMVAATSLVRDDLAVCASWRPPPAPLPVPIDVFAGVDDAMVGLAGASEWSRYTTGGCALHPVPGGHFFIRESPETFLPLLAASLAAAAPAAHGGSPAAVPADARRGEQA
ncbi:MULTISPECIES: thioesterase II family protein [unclassified Pseudofrankia]|uniref:thioesterase II family protein n=1 Tax=unclassified Pseudofrankia TaxID=2994372 RepID=UPI0008DA3FC9|nr:MULTISPECIES: thioesterase domain-containing protein [unclassified Pseudofrankia]MDT3440007.1 thioesterase domain-containing protein [Pseudofrankia sp. BMG5.37]OHV56752.1 hypothetical protein BCD48_43555 [Pseudofrankia sp. BMG5.36]